MKVLVLGHATMVGHVVAIYFGEQGHEVYGYDESKCDDFLSKHGICKEDTGRLDDYARLEKIIRDGRFDAIINCTAIINDAAECDPVKAIQVNSLLPHWLVEITKNSSTVVVHRSTDCIFSGAKGQYAINDWPDRNNFYGRSKALGEIINDKDITIRISLIGPEMNEEGTGLFNWFYNQKKSVNGFVSAIWTGVTTIEFARQIEWLLANHIHGLFQTVPDKSINKYDLIALFEKYYPGERDIVKVNNDRVDRSLIQVKPEGLLVPTYEEQIADMRCWTDRHSDIYRYQ